MNSPTSFASIFLSLFILIAVSGFIQAQPLSLSNGPIAFKNSPSPKTAAPTAAADGDIDFGSVTGRVVYDVRPSAESKELVTNGVGGARIMLRRLDGRLANFFFERLSDADGNYEFQSVRPGRYTIEIDRSTLSTDVPSLARKIAIIDVAIAKRSHFDIYIAPQRMITGVVFIDVDGDGKFKAGKDHPVEGACVTANGSLAVSDANGAYVLTDLPPGRIGLLVTAPKRNENTHVVLDLGSGATTNRVVNVAMSR